MDGRRALGLVGLLALALGLGRIAQIVTYHTQITLIAPPHGDLRQTTEVTCGPAALRFLLLEKFGRDVPESEIAQLAGTNSQGTSLYDLKEASAALGFRATTWRWQKNDLQDLQLPVMVYLHRWRHYGVLTYVDDDHVRVFDPLRGDLQFSRRAFDYFWNGIALTVEEPV